MTQLFVDYAPAIVPDPRAFVAGQRVSDYDVFEITELSPMLTLVPGDKVLAGPNGEISQVLEARPVLVAMVGFDLQEEIDIEERVATWNRSAYAVVDSDRVAFVATTNARWLAENVQCDPAVVLFELERTPDTDMRIEILVDRRFSCLRDQRRLRDEEFDRWMKEID